jgi:hypothetical protein
MVVLALLGLLGACATPAEMQQRRDAEVARNEATIIRAAAAQCGVSEMLVAAEDDQWTLRPGQGPAFDAANRCIGQYYIENGGVIRVRQ